MGDQLEVVAAVEVGVGLCEEEFCCCDDVGVWGGACASGVGLFGAGCVVFVGVFGGVVRFGAIVVAAGKAHRFAAAVWESSPSARAECGRHCTGGGWLPMSVGGGGCTNYVYRSAAPCYRCSSLRIRKIGAAPMRSVSSAVIGGGLASSHPHLMSELSGSAVVECLSPTLVSGGVGFAFRHSLGAARARADSWSLTEAVVVYAIGTHRAARMDRVPLGGGGAASAATQKRGPTRLVDAGNCSLTFTFRLYVSRSAVVEVFRSVVVAEEGKGRTRHPALNQARSEFPGDYPRCRGRNRSQHWSITEFSGDGADRPSRQ